VRVSRAATTRRKRAGATACSSSPAFFYELAAGRKRKKFGWRRTSRSRIDARRLSRGEAPLSQFPHYVRVQFFCLPDPGGLPARVDARCSSARTAGTARQRMRLGRKKHSMLGYSGEYLPDWRYFPVRHESVENIGRSQRRLVRPFLFGHSDVKKDNQRPPHRYRIARLTPRECSESVSLGLSR